MDAQVAVAVVGHVARQDQAHRLARKIDGRLFLDSGELGELTNHRRAWTWATQSHANWTLVIQDDAVPIDGMLDHLSAGLTTLPQPGLVSLYLGTSYPTQHQRSIRRALQRADRTGATWIVSDQLLHGVAVSAPTRYAPIIADTLRATDKTAPIVTTLKDGSKPYDEQLSDLAQAEGWPVYYPVPSLVDHADGPTLLNHADGRGREKPRHAWRTGAPNWNSKTVQL